MLGISLSRGQQYFDGKMARRNRCRICGSRNLVKFLDLGLSPLANRFLREDQLGEPEPRFPLDVHMCEACSLVQLLEIVDPEVLFRDYIYVSGTSDTMRAHFRSFAEALLSRFDLGAGDLIVEVASNDGTFLLNFQGRGPRTIGIEPAANIVAIARERGIDTFNEFFSPDVAARVRAEEGAARCILATNVFAHVDHLDGFVEGVRRLLDDDGFFVFENSYVRDMLARLEFDSVYHEHLSYFSVTALAELFRRHRMEIFDVEHTPVHGGSLRVFVQGESGPHQITEAPGQFLREEREQGICESAPYVRFGEQVYRLKDELSDLVRELRASGKRVVAYGSSAKGNTLLNFMEFDSSVIEYVVDKSPLKQGTYTPGTHLPVRPVECLVEDRPDYALILAWNYTEEIQAQQRQYTEGGGRFISAMPVPRILSTPA